MLATVGCEVMMERREMSVPTAGRARHVNHLCGSCATPMRPPMRLARNVPFPESCRRIMTQALGLDLACPQPFPYFIIGKLSRIAASTTITLGSCTTFAHSSTGRRSCHAMSQRSSFAASHPLAPTLLLTDYNPSWSIDHDMTMELTRAKTYALINQRMSTFSRMFC